MRHASLATNLIVVVSYSKSGADRKKNLFIDQFFFNDEHLKRNSELNVAVKLFRLILQPLGSLLCLLSLLISMASMPEKYKHLSPYLTLSNEHAKRDPAIHYWCLVYFVQRAIEIDKKSPDCTAFLGEKLKYLEEFKAQNRQLREITDELEAQCHLEEYSKKLFTFADNSDRSGVFNKNIVKAFHSAAHLMDVLTTFGELSESIAEMRKYARWKAAYLFTCMKEGLVPVPGPMEDAEGKGGVQGDSTGTVNAAASSSRSPAQEALSPRGNESLNGSQSTNEYEKSLTRSEEYSKAQKLCKYAISALEYEDINTAIDNISKALELLKAERGE
uniref:Vta1 C-terminal domain-containing protein n=1 Tax=Trichuris muris TaxID=70415 RepID=A0A5S6QLR8_TRIMR